MFMFMFANLSSDGKIDPVPVAAVADEAWDASTFEDVATLRLPRKAMNNCSRSTRATTQPMRTVLKGR